MGFAAKMAAASSGAPYPGGPASGPPPQQGGSQQYQAYNPGRPGPNQSSRLQRQTMSKFSQGLNGAPGAPYPMGTPQGPPHQPPQPQWQGSNNLQPNYGAPTPPPRPGASPQPYQQPQQYSPYPPSSPQPGAAYGGAPYQQQPPPPQQYGTPQQYNQSPQPYPPPSQQQQQQYGRPPQFQQQGPGYGPPQGGYAQQGGQPQYPGGPQQGGPPPQQGGYGGPPQQAPQNAGAYRNLIQSAIQEKGLQNFYPPGHPMIEQIVNRAGQQVSALAANWRIQMEIASDIVKLALYDVILYVDDSGSMAFEENGSRIDDLKLILSRVAFATGLFDDDGIQVRFMNSQEQGNNIKSEQQVNDMISRTKFSGLTPMGRELQNKVLGPLVLNPARSGQLRKPVLVITITDGQPTGESTVDIANIIKNASGELARNPRYGKGALAFQFAQVGNDLKAREFLSNLDEDKSIGDIIDCTSNYEVEADEMTRANPPVNLTPDMWLIKLLLGSIDSSYDTKDEKSAGGHGQGGYGGPPQGQYGAPQGGYGGPPPGQGGYGAPQGGYGGPQQGGYQPQQGGYGGPQQGGYPPQQGGYPGQQGGYGRSAPQGGQGGQGGYGQPPAPPRY